MLGEFGTRGAGVDGGVGGEGAPDGFEFEFWDEAAASMGIKPAFNMNRAQLAHTPIRALGTIGLCSSERRDDYVEAAVRLRWRSGQLRYQPASTEYMRATPCSSVRWQYLPAIKRFDCPQDVVTVSSGALQIRIEADVSERNSH